MGILSHWFGRWFGKDLDNYQTLTSNVSYDESGTALIDVRGQTCPGYLLSINLAVNKLPVGSQAKLLITYPPCGEDVKAWARERSITVQDVRQEADRWVVTIRK